MFCTLCAEHFIVSVVLILNAYIIIVFFIFRWKYLAVQNKRRNFAIAIIN